MSLLLVGFSVRALVESAVSAGVVDFHAADFFNDWDLRRLSKNLNLLQNKSDLVSVLRKYGDGVVVYSSILENEPELLLSAGSRILGNGYSVIKQIRPGREWWKLAAELGIRIPDVSIFPPEGGLWVRKPFKSGGGRKISFYLGGRDRIKFSESYYFQRFIEGESFSFLFVANGKSARLLGETLQLIGFSQLGGNGFKWCGNIYPANLSEHVIEEVRNWIEKMVATVGMKGVAGVDVVVRNGVPYLIEVNPRYTASMELMEMSTGVSIWEIHIRGCKGELPKTISAPDGYIGKGILYAREEMHGFNSELMWENGFRDIPMECAVVPKNTPVCSMYGWGGSVEEVIYELIRKRDWVYERGVKDGELCADYRSHS